jgi:excisionase family DNA binding protein
MTVDSMLTLTEAAKETGLTRAGIHKAIKRGRLSATKDENGHYLIDAAELFRVYQPVDRPSLQQNTAVNDSIDSQLIAQRLEFTQQLLRQVENERDSLRHNLSQAMAMLTHQPEAPQAAPHRAKHEDSLLWRKLFSKRN